MKTAINQPNVNVNGRNENELFQKGMSLMDRKRYASAQKNFDIVLLLNPANVDAMLQRGMCKLYAGMVNPALDDFSDILMVANGKPEAYAAMAKAYWMLADYTMAKQFIDEALRSHSSLQSEWYALASNINSKLNDIPAAYACINRAIVCNPFSAVYHYRRARLLFQMGKNQVALNDLNKAITFEPEFTAALKLRSACKKAMGDVEGARKDLITAGLYYRA